MPYFRSLNVNFPKQDSSKSPQELYWSYLQFPVTVKEFASINFIDFSPVEPHYFAVTSSAKVCVYSPATNKIYKRLSKFKETAYGASFRRDGRVLIAGSEDGIVRLFDVKAKALLRDYKGHKRAVQRCKFTADSSNIVSFSDDRTVKVWDPTDETVISSFTGHTDYVRAGTVDPLNTNLILSGSYDHSIRMYDTRMKECVSTVDHGAPVEDVLYLPSSQMFVSCGSTDVKVWETRAGGRLLAKLTQHHKTVTSLCLANDGESLMSASLDRHVKVYDLSSFQVVHTLDYPSAILSVRAAPNSKVLAVGMADGLLSIQHWRKRVKVREPPPARGPVHEFNIQHTVIGTGQSDVMVKEERAKKLAVHEVFLKNFNGSKALDSALIPKSQNKVRHYVTDSVGMAVIQELIRRKFIRGALAGRTATKLRPIISIIKRKMHTQSYSGTAVDVINLLLDIYTAEMGEDRSLDGLFLLLQQHVDWEADVMSEMMVLKGSIEMILAANQAKLPTASSNTLT